MASTLHERRLAIAAWVAFLLVVGGVAELTLAACDLGIHPLFGLSYCPAQGANLLAAEQDRERDLLDLLHRAQLDLARLPVCLPDPPRREPERHADNVVPTPTPTRTPTPIPTPTPTPTPSPTPDDALTIPRNLSDLKGCWQSVNGDIQMSSDNADATPTGKVRICYCFAGNGRGETRYIYQDGDKCTGRLRAQLSQDRMTMSHGRIDCTGNKGYVVPTDIMCSNKAGEDSATCDTHSHGRYPSTTSDEKYHRVDPEYCR